MLLECDDKIEDKESVNVSQVTVIGVTEVPDEFETFGEARENGELAVEGTRAEEEIEHALVLGLAGLPIGVRHRDLVQV